MGPHPQQHQQQTVMVASMSMEMLSSLQGAQAASSAMPRMHNIHLLSAFDILPEFGIRTVCKPDLLLQVMA